MITLKNTEVIFIFVFMDYYDLQSKSDDFPIHPGFKC